MSARWEPLWKPRDSSSTWHAEWRVPVSASTRLLDPEYDGSSQHPAARVAPKPVDSAALPEDFALGVVFGPSGSGKSSLLQDLAEHYGLAAARRDAFEFPASMAVCSHAGLRGEGIDRLSCVGLNRVPSWLKPAQVLSDGERQRVLCALSLETGAILDDFAVVVDERNAASMAASLSKFVRGRGLRRVLVSTTKRCVLPFLAPDFVLFTLSGCVKLNPFSLEQRRVTLTISSDGLGFSGGKGGGWQGPIDNASLEAKKVGAGQARSPYEVADGTVPQTLRVTVHPDDSCHEAANAFDFDFDGRSEQVVHVLSTSALQDATGGQWSLAAIVGPSGTGKSYNMRQLAGGGGGQAVLSWDDQAVIDQLHADAEQARALAEAVALPTAVVLRPWTVLSTGERARVEVARRLGTASSGCPVLLDEFTSCLDRTTARQVCWGVSRYIRSTAPPLQVVVATVHEDILGWLLPDWVLESRCGTVTVMRGPAPTASTLDAVHRMRTLRPNLSATTGADVEELRELLKPPTLSFSLRRLDGCTESRAVYEELFEEHHYLKGKAPWGLFGLLLRETQSNQPVAFHGVALQVGGGFTNMTLRESRLVVLPDFQGFGLGPRLSNRVGELLTKSGATLYAKTAHPRLGGYRDDHDELWRPTSTNRKPSQRTMGDSIRLKRKRARKTGDQLAASSASRRTMGDSIRLKRKRARKTGDQLANPLPAALACRSFESACPACRREAMAALGMTLPRGRPPKHTCGVSTLHTEDKERTPGGLQSSEELVEQVAACGAMAADAGDARDAAPPPTPRSRICYSHRFVGVAALEQSPAPDVASASQCSTQAPSTPGASQASTQASQESSLSGTGLSENLKCACRVRQRKALAAKKLPSRKEQNKVVARKDSEAVAGYADDAAASPVRDLMACLSDASEPAPAVVPEQTSETSAPASEATAMVEQVAPATPEKTAAATLDTAEMSAPERKPAAASAVAGDADDAAAPPVRDLMACLSDASEPAPAVAPEQTSQTSAPASEATAMVEQVAPATPEKIVAATLDTTETPAPERKLAAASDNSAAAAPSTIATASMDLIATPPCKRKLVQQTLLHWRRDAPSSTKHRKVEAIDCDA